MKMIRVLVGVGLGFVIAGGVSPVRAITGSWTNNSAGNWTNSANWADGIIPNYAGDVAYLTNNITAARTITLSSTVTNGAIEVGDADGSNVFTIGGTAGTNIFDNSGSGAALTMSASSTNTTVSVASVVLADSLSVSNLSAASVLTLSSAVSGGGALSMAGGPGVILSGSNTYSGGTVLQSGLLKLGHNSSLGVGALTIQGGTLDVTATRVLTNNAVNQSWNGDFAFGGSATLDAGFGSVTLGGSHSVTVMASTLTLRGSIGDGAGSYSLTKAGEGALVLTGTNTYEGGTVLNAGELDVNGLYALGTGPLTINGGIFSVTAAGITNLNNNEQVWNSDFTWPGRYSLPMGNGAVTLNANVTITNPVSIYSGILTVGGVIDDGVGSYSLTFDGYIGGLALAGANTYEGGTILNNGRLYINHAQALGTGPLTINGGQIDNYSGVTISNANNNAQFWNQDFSFYGHATLHMGTGMVTLGSSLVVSNLNNLMSVSGSIDDGANTFSLTKRGNGTLALAGENTYGGGTTIEGGALQLDHPKAIAPGLVTIKAGSLSTTIVAGYSNANNNAQVWDGDFSLVGGRSVHLGVGPVTLARSCLVEVLYAGLTVGGVIDDGGNGFGLIKGRANTLVLAAANTYSGNTTITNGTLALSGSGSIANSAVIELMPGPSNTATLSVSGRLDGTLTLGAAQTLRGNGMVSGNVTNDGTMAPGASAGVLTVTGGYQQSGKLEIELGGTTPGTEYDVLTVSSSAILGGALTVTNLGSYTPVAGNIFTVLTASAVSGTFATTNLPAGSWTLEYKPTAVVLTYVAAGGGPELGVSPVSLSFAPTRVGETSDLSFTVTNSGTAQLDGTATVSGVSFSVPSGSPFSVAAGASASVTVRFAPTETAGYAGDVTFLSNGGDSTNAVGGTGYVQASATNGTMSLVGGQPTIGFTLVSGSLYRVQATTNVLDGTAWVDVTGYLTNNFSGGAVPPYADTNAAAYPRRIYRISSP